MLKLPAWQMPMEWSELGVARLTYPTLSIDDQLSWLTLDSVNYSAQQPEGHFTFRRLSNRYGKSMEDHLAAGHSHALMVVRGQRPDPRDKNNLLFLFMVDIRRAMLRENLGIDCVNRNDNTPFILYNVMTPGVDKFCERLRTR